MKLEIVILAVLGVAILSIFNYLDKVEEQKFNLIATKKLTTGID